MNKTIEITIDPKGEATVQTMGFAGASCKEASRLIEQALGEKTAERQTAEFYQNVRIAQHARQQH